ncbi:MAG TPA: hypothetical protein ENK18_05455, partial [Deltaproteobacteria bacterium]|nr:hypothetical protein [Deltaproteobacteria bacterium]
MPTASRRSPDGVRSPRPPGPGPCRRHRAGALHRPRPAPAAPWGDRLRRGRSGQVPRDADPGVAAAPGGADVALWGWARGPARPTPRAARSRSAGPVLPPIDPGVRGGPTQLRPPGRDRGGGARRGGRSTARAVQADPHPLSPPIPGPHRARGRLCHRGREAALADTDPSTRSAAPWPSARGGPLGLGLGQGLGGSIGAGPRALAHLETAGPVLATPVIDEHEHVFVGSADHGLYAFDPRGQEILWRFDAGARIEASVALVGSEPAQLVVPCTDGVLYGLGPGGDEVWRYDLVAQRPRLSPSAGHGWRSSPVCGASGLVVIGNDDFHVYGFEADGTLRWATPTGLPVRSAPAITADGSVLVAGTDLNVVCLEPEGGRICWRRGVGNLVTGGIAASETLAIVATAGGAVHALDIASGAIRWTRSLGSPILGSVAALGEGGGWVVGTADGRLVALGPTGQLRWSVFLAAPLRSSPAVSPGEGGGIIYVGASDGRLHAVGADGRRRWTFDPWSERDAPRGVALGSVALGRTGVAVASLSGDVLYV